MVAAPVGFQCPECAGQSPASQPASTLTAQSGGLRRARAPKSIMRNATVTWVLVGLCGFGFLLELVAGSDLIFAKYGLVPLAVADGEWWRLLTGAFLHAGLIHLAFNLLVLIMIGPAVEAMVGHVRFLVLFVLSALGGATFSYAQSAPLSLSVGASGAIFGLMGALVVAGRKLSIDVTQVAVLIGINLVISFLPGVGIDWRAHIGGLVTGALTGAVLAHAPRRHTALTQALGCAVIMIVMVGVVSWRTEALRAGLPPQFASTTANAAAQHVESGPGSPVGCPQVPPTLGRTTAV